jgi:3-hydroxy-9,10-secoandrosta-1,3,5(10)-triene-9,17-dione monooxygenase reductase component
MTVAPAESAESARSAEAVEPFSSDDFRRTLGHFCTGVTVVTTSLDGVPAGFACQSFAAVSLDPPLVLFCPAKQSRTWPAIEQAGRFCVNVLAGDQAAVSALFGGRREGKFEQTPWALSPGGMPVLSGVLTWIDCTVQAVHDAGDHFIVTGAVEALGGADPRSPLLFHRGEYTVTAPPPARAVESWLGWSRPDDWI